MIKTILCGTDLIVSRFSFGTASLHHLKTEKRRFHHLLDAAEAGFTHFDTAPLYGFGSAERSLGAAFEKRHDITIATKVGLYPPGGANQRNYSMLIRKLAGRVVRPFSRAVVDLSTNRARLSVEDSMRRLRRDHIDLLLLHEPIFSLMDTDEWHRWLEDVRNRVRVIGVAGPARIVAPFLEVGSPFAQVIQCRDGLEKREADVVFGFGRSLQLTYGYLSSNTTHLSGEEILRRALRRNRTGSILITTRSQQRLRSLGRLGAEPSAHVEV